ncbi:hypothetical protein N8I74_06335 [Chitiniphilus purpureus]|uniref:Zorya protein ZorC EH domain-containing protein n=1 Tax=Chitiniphilus purpureus TaxID=2981137 RepID=A0ABY6DXR9_9NEIS|nr:hypothetical protein [Chitiniphilus sp. CD1]UXY16633.1 hypothetical protein N8I74_06335 [Chitiniphilus sp. CD1]
MFDFKGLVSALFSRQRPDGVHDYKSATMFMQELPESDLLQAHIEIVKALKQLNGNLRISLKERIRTVPYLDEKARPLQQHLVEVYFGRLIDEHIQPHQALPAVLAYWHQMAEGYRLCVKHAAQTGARNLDRQLQVFTLRALHLYNQEVKWGCLRYMEIDGRTWRNLNRLYLYAEQHQFATTPLQPYGNDEITDARREYLQAQMLVLSSPEKMQPSQIELAWQWLRRWCARIELESQIRPNRQLFAVNLASASAPKRLRRDMVGEHWRYWFTEALVLHVRSLCQEFELSEQPDARQHGLPAESTDPASLELMTRLINLWSRDVPAPVRRHERRAARRRVQVVRGLDNVIHFLHGLRALDAPPVHAEHWLLENESQGGYGVNYSGKSDDRLLVGEIIGLGATDARNFAVGVIRRITKRRDGQVQVGIERLSANPLVVELTPTQSQHSFLGLYASENGNAAQERVLMLPQTFFAAYREFRLAAQGKSYRIRLDPALEQTAYTAISRFSVLQRLSA